MSDVRPPHRHTREASGLRLDRELRWWHDGEPIDHPRIIEAFNRGLRPRPDGRFELRLGGDWCVVDVEDAAYGVVALESDGADGLRLGLSDRTEELLRPETLRLARDGVLECQVKEGRARARFLRDAHFALGERLEQTPRGWMLSLGTRTLPVPGLDSGD